MEVTAQTFIQSKFEDFRDHIGKMGWSTFIPLSVRIRGEKQVAIVRLGLIERIVKFVLTLFKSNEEYFQGKLAGVESLEGKTIKVLEILDKTSKKVADATIASDVDGEGEPESPPPVEVPPNDPDELMETSDRHEDIELLVIERSPPLSERIFDDGFDFSTVTLATIEEVFDCSGADRDREKGECRIRKGTFSHDCSFRLDVAYSDQGYSRTSFNITKEGKVWTYGGLPDGKTFPTFRGLLDHAYTYSVSSQSCKDPDYTLECLFLEKTDGRFIRVKVEESD